MIRAAYLAADGFVADLVRELGLATEAHERLVLSSEPPRDAAWAQNTWLEPRLIRIASIKDAARALRAIQRNWALYSFRDHRRAKLIEAELPSVSARPIEPYAALPSAPLGSFTLLDRDTVLASPRCSSPFPNGEIRFVEDREGPPSRAYLKLWELFTRIGVRPAPGDRCVDLGSAPGGWTWALASLGCEVLSVDKAELDPRVAALPGVTHRRESAFALDPRDAGRVDWLLSDVICYPARLLSLVERWLAAKPETRIVTTIKLQGETDHDTVAAFARIPGARLVHLFHNRHELTFFRV